MRVLFVDDDQAVLNGLRRMLFRARGEWEMDFAAGGEQALELLAERAYDVVVTDMRMPKVDGIAVLRTLREQHPATVRIVLSGHTEMEAAMRTVPLAHQFLTKPCDADDLRGTIERAVELQQRLARTSLLSVLGEVDALPSPPAVVTALNEELSGDDVDVDHVLQLIGSDPAISAKVLQLVNSAFFGLQRHVSDVSQAVRYLGVTTVRNLAVAAHAFQAVGDDSPGREVVDAVGRHSGLVVARARLLLADKRAAQEVFAPALLHDIGLLVFATRASDDFERLAAVAEREGRPLHELEADHFGIDHAALGAHFLTLWGLPYPVVEAVARHHEPRQLVPDTPLTPGDATWVAELLVHHDGAEPDWREGALPPLPEDARAHPAVAAVLAS